MTRTLGPPRAPEPGQRSTRESSRENSAWHVGAISDDELSELALDDVEDRPLADDAFAINLLPTNPSSLLSAWYMPPVATRRVVGWRKWVMLTIVGIFLILEILGLCSVFGQVVIG